MPGHGTEMDLSRILNTAGQVLQGMDGALLTMAATHYDPSVRVRLIKFYTMFKIVEVLRFQEFRGFP
jgi:hypothetical protein